MSICLWRSVTDDLVLQVLASLVIQLLFNLIFLLGILRLDRHQPRIPLIHLVSFEAIQVVQVWFFFQAFPILLCLHVGYSYSHSMQE